MHLVSTLLFSFLLQDLFFYRLLSRLIGIKSHRFLFRIRSRNIWYFRISVLRSYFLKFYFIFVVLLYVGRFMSWRRATQRARLYLKSVHTDVEELQELLCFLFINRSRAYAPKTGCFELEYDHREFIVAHKINYFWIQVCKIRLKCT